MEHAEVVELSAAEADRLRKRYPNLRDRRRVVGVDDDPVGDVVAAVEAEGTTAIRKPASWEQARRNLAMRRRILDEFGALSAAELGEWATPGAANPHQYASRLRKANRVFSVPFEGRALFLGFQFDEHGRPFGALVDALASHPCQGEPTRFAPLLVDTRCVPTLYAAETLDAVLMESVFHDVILDRADGDPPEVYFADLKTVRRSTIASRRDLRLGRLDDDALPALGVERAELIESDADSYPDTVLWAQHAHRHGAADDERLDGLIWHSRRAAQGLASREPAMVLFGDRVARKELRSSGAPVPLTAAAGFDELDSVANRLGVTLVR